MQELAELDLHYLPVDEPEFAAEPFSHFVTARQRHPWLAKGPFGYILTENRAIREIVRYEDKLRMGHYRVVEMMDAVGTPWGRFIADNMQAQTGAVHQRLRDVLRHAFSPREANRQRPLMREVIANVLDEWAPKGRFDFEEFASHFPITVMCRILGASPDMAPQLRSSFEAMGLAFGLDKRHLPTLQQAIITVDDYVHELVADRRAGGRNGDDKDLLDHLIEANDSGGLLDEELYSLLIFLFGAGYDTSKNILTFIMHVLLDRPEMYARCADDLPYCHKVTEETLRYHSVANANRIVDEEFVYRGVRLPRDTMLMLPRGVAGRDPTAVEDPDRFDPERPEGSPHIAFGLGPHICLGQFIARAQIEEGLHQIAQRIRNPRLVGPVGWRPFPGVWGIRGLPIEFDPAEAIPAT